MALTPEARRLTEEHRRAQAANQQGFLREFLAAWRLLDVRDLDSSTPSWLQVVMRLIELFRQDSARLSLDYARRYRRLELPDTDIELPEIDFFSGVGPRVLRELPRSATRVPRAGRGRPRNRIPLRPVDGRLVINWRDRDPQVEASLRVTGPYTVKHRIGQGEPPERALRNAEAHAGGAALRHVNDGGRDTALTVVQNDRAALGWIRLTAADPCGFCAMLASRGITWGRYSKESFAASDIKFAGDPRADGATTAKVHDQCVVPGTLVTGPSTELGYRRPYEGELVVIGLAGGRELSITPNHPVLTDRGWVPAGLLREGDDVLCRGGADLAALQVPHEDDVPTPIEDVWGSHRVDALGAMPVAAEDFHGDGRGTESYVDVVATDRFLASEVDLQRGQHLAEQFVSSSGLAAVAVSLASSSDPLADLVGLGDPADSVVGRLGLGGVLLGGQLCREHAVGLREPSAFDPRLLQPAADDASRHSEVLSDLLLGGSVQVPLSNVGPGRRFDPASAPVGPLRADGDPLSRQIVADRVSAYANLGRALTERLARGVELRRVVEIRRIQYSGHVFNLQTVEGWYSANDVIVSNCRCIVAPVWRRDDPRLDDSKQWRQMWNDNIRNNYGGKDAINAWRRLYERPDVFKRKLDEAQPRRTRRRAA